MTRKIIIAGNWKMNKTKEEASQFFNDISIVDKQREIIICAPFTLLNIIYEQAKEKNISLGAQNMYYEDKGAFTGEISPTMLLDANCKYVILGHSERRQYFNENNELINKKINSALKNNINPILCIGETLQERESNQTFSIIETQLKECLKDVDINNIIIAYEPIWAIGTGKTATPDQAEEVHAHIRRLLENMYNKEASQNTSIIYGGSVKPDNIKELMEKENIDGALPGGASLDAKSFSDICNF